MLIEIDILLKAAGKSCAVVEKASHVLWTFEELVEAREAGRFQGEDQILAPDRHLEVSGPFPGCLQQTGAARASYRPVGQTEHFVIFAASEVGPSFGQEWGD
jgi:hypothetical protein